MRIQYMSDLHMELWDNSRYIKANEFDAVGDVTVRGDSWQWMFRENVGYYYNKVVRIDDTDFVLTRIRTSTPQLATPESCATN